jgi:hypothetical protein
VKLKSKIKLKRKNSNNKYLPGKIKEQRVKAMKNKSNNLQERGKKLRLELKEMIMVHGELGMAGAGLEEILEDNM